MAALTSLLLLTTITFLTTSVADDGTAMLALAKSFNPPPSDWSTKTSTRSCKWSGVRCTSADKSLSGVVAPEISTLSELKTVALQRNKLSGKIPSFAKLSMLRTNSGVSSGSESSDSSGGSSRGDNKSPLIVGVIVAILVFLAIVGFAVYKFLIRKNNRESRKRDVENPQEMICHNIGNGGGEYSNGNGVNSNSLRVFNIPSTVGDNSWERNLREGRIDTVPMQVLLMATNNFSKENILGKGAFGEVYFGVLPDKTKIAVKKMNSSAMGDKGMEDFQAEIAVLLKAKHRNLVALLGYCVSGNEWLLVYQYMPQGNLKQHLLEWCKLGCSPLTWKQRVSIALDVAHAVEYLHSFAQQCFIHRDLKPDNILLGDDMRAKVGDFGLIKNAADGKYSVVTRVGGTVGYLAPEYAESGRVTPKVDVYAFGVILLELLTGRKVIDNTLPKERSQLVIWFTEIQANRENIPEALDQTLEVDDETMETIHRVAELAGHCTAHERQHRPDMGHVVNVLSQLVEKWKPPRQDEVESSGIDVNMSLPQALERWRNEGSYPDSLSDELRQGMDHAINVLDPLVEKCKTSCQEEEEEDPREALRKQLVSEAYADSLSNTDRDTDTDRDTVTDTDTDSEAYTENGQMDADIIESLRRHLASEEHPEVLEMDAYTREARWNQVFLEAISDVAKLSDPDTNILSDKDQPNMDHVVNVMRPLVGKCKSSRHEEEEGFKIDVNMRVPQDLQRPSYKEEEESFGNDKHMSFGRWRERQNCLLPGTDSLSYTDTLADTETISDKQTRDMNHSANMLRRYLERYDMSREEKEEILGKGPEFVEALWREIVSWSRRRSRKRKPATDNAVNVLGTLVEKCTPSCQEEEENLGIDASMSVPEAQRRLLVSGTVNVLDPLVEKCKTSCQEDTSDALWKQLVSEGYTESLSDSDSDTDTDTDTDSEAYTENGEMDAYIFESLRRHLVSEGYPELLEMDAYTLEALWIEVVLEAISDVDTLSYADKNTLIDHVVNVMGPLVEKCKSSRQEEEEGFKIDVNMRVPQALQRPSYKEEEEESFGIDKHMIFDQIWRWRQRRSCLLLGTETLSYTDTLADTDTDTILDKQTRDMSCEEKEEILGNSPEVLKAVWREIVLRSRRSRKRRPATDKAVNMLGTLGEKCKPSCQEEEENLGIDESMSVPEAQRRLSVSDTDSVSDIYSDALSDTLSETNHEPRS